MAIPEPRLCVRADHEHEVAFERGLLQITRRRAADFQSQLLEHSSIPENPKIGNANLARPDHGPCLWEPVEAHYLAFCEPDRITDLFEYHL